MYQQRASSVEQEEITLRWCGSAAAASGMKGSTYDYCYYLMLNVHTHICLKTCTRCANNYLWWESSSKAAAAWDTQTTSYLCHSPISVMSTSSSTTPYCTSNRFRIVCYRDTILSMFVLRRLGLEWMVLIPILIIIGIRRQVEKLVNSVLLNAHRRPLPHASSIYLSGANLRMSCPI